MQDIQDMVLTVGDPQTHKPHQPATSVKATDIGHGYWRTCESSDVSHPSSNLPTTKYRMFWTSCQSRRRWVGVCIELKGVTHDPLFDLRHKNEASSAPRQRSDLVQVTAADLGRQESSSCGRATAESASVSLVVQDGDQAGP